MKATVALVCIFSLLAAFPACSHQPPTSSPALAAVRGAATVTELANVVFTAIQSNDFEQLPLYVPTDAELKTLKNKSSEDMQALLENLTTARLTAQLKESFNTVIQEGVAKTLNLSELTLADARAGQPDAKNKMLLPVTATLTTRANQAVPLRFEALQINGRYFLFQRLEWQSVN